MTLELSGSLQLTLKLLDSLIFLSVVVFQIIALFLGFDHALNLLLLLLDIDLELGALLLFGNQQLLFFLQSNLVVLKARLSFLDLLIALFLLLIDLFLQLKNLILALFLTLLILSRLLDFNIFNSLIALSEASLLLLDILLALIKLDIQFFQLDRKVLIFLAQVGEFVGLGLQLIHLFLAVLQFSFDFLHFLA